MTGVSDPAAEPDPTPAGGTDPAPDPAPGDPPGGDVDDDLAAEPDTATPADADDAGDGDPVDDGPWYFGSAMGGPYSGLPLISRFPKGILLVDRPNNQAWVLDYEPGASLFIARDPEELDTDGLWHAAEQDDFDVRAYDPDFTGDEAPGA